MIFVAIMSMIALFIIIVMYQKRKHMSVVIISVFNLGLLYVGSNFFYQYIHQNDVLYPDCDIDPLCMNETGMLMVFGVFVLALALIGLLSMAILIVSINQKQKRNG